MFDDRPVEIAELTYVIKQDLASLNSQISSLQSLSKTQKSQSARNAGAEQEGEHNKNVRQVWRRHHKETTDSFQVVVLLQGKLADVGVNFKEVLEVRTKNIQASRSRTENFVSSVSSHSQPSLETRQSASPLYNTPTKSRTPQPGYQNSNSDILNLDPSSASSSSALTQSRPQSDQQLLMMEEAQPTNTYINMRGEAIDVIEKTISELGSVFGQLAAMVSEQGFVIFPFLSLPFPLPHLQYSRKKSAKKKKLTIPISPTEKWSNASTQTQKMWSTTSKAPNAN